MTKQMYLKPRRTPVARFTAAVRYKPRHMSDIIKDRVHLEPDMAARLARVLGASTRFWINLHANVDAYDAERAARDWKPSTTYRAKAA